MVCYLKPNRSNNVTVCLFVCRVQSFRGKDPWPEGTDDDQQCQLQLHVSPLHTEAHTLRQVQHNTRAHTHTGQTEVTDYPVFINVAQSFEDLISAVYCVRLSHLKSQLDVCVAQGHTHTSTSLPPLWASFCPRVILVLARPIPGFRL